MARHTTWRIGGPADALVVPETFDQLLRVRQEARAAGVPQVVIGQGSNLLFADEGFRGVVIKIGKPLNQIAVDGTRMVLEAGALTCRAALAACRNRLAGLEHIVGIPGTMGGLIAMNGGSLRKCIGDVVEWVEGCDGEGQPFRMDRKACRFSYRDSRFLREPGLVVFRCALSLTPGERPAIRRAMLDDLKERRRKFPLHLPNCGSVFKSSPELYALAGPPGKIIEDCGFKGRRIGGAEVSPRHANFITNIGQAKATDVLDLIRRIRIAVHRRWGVWMEAEVKYVQPQGGVIPAHDSAVACGM
jgi:UDP-N-acetylmuramate dehydrogenase